MHEAEQATGLQLCVYLGPTEEDARAHAEALFEEHELHTRPAVLVLVAPLHRRAEIVTSEAARGRLRDADCEVAMAAMIERFRLDDLAGGVIACVERLAAAAGPGSAAPASEQLPDVIDG